MMKISFIDILISEKYRKIFVRKKKGARKFAILVALELLV